MQIDIEERLKQFEPSELSLRNAGMQQSVRASWTHENWPCLKCPLTQLCARATFENQST